jgi:hypothetical protein
VQTHQIRSPRPQRGWNPLGETTAILLLVLLGCFLLFS